MSEGRMKRRPFRHEIKYLISDREAEILKRRFSELLPFDDHAGEKGYFIRSLYFDDINRSSLKEKEAGITSRKKYRIRIYNTDDSRIMLERKKKEGQFIHKTSVALDRIEYEWLRMGQLEFLRNRPEELCQSFYEEYYRLGMRPIVIVDYDRVPFVYPFGDVRLTFDANIAGASPDEDLFDREISSYSVLPPGTQILEVKYTEYLPDLVRDLLYLEGSIQISASKYVMCLQKKDELLFRGNEVIL